MREVESVSLRLLRMTLWVLSYRDVIVAEVCAAFVLAGLDQGNLVSIPIFFAIGYFVPRNDQ
jgi:hypothetical protein